MWKKGQSGNPKGRPADNAELRVLCRVHTAAAIKALVAALANPKERVAAASALLDRGYGKPTQPLGGEDGGSIVLEVITGVVRSEQGAIGSGEGG